MSPDDPRPLVGDLSDDEFDELVERWDDRGREVVIHSPARCGACVRAGHEGRPILYDGQWKTKTSSGREAIVRYHSCPRCGSEFVSVERIAIC